MLKKVKANEAFT